ncbi:macro domain-containing protein [Acinetobacter baumannii]|uniref:type II toxin-antitoxin system antitoxin DNA ADP-ribosyl glycohydrolase DarG n=1 Tax=Acinetobacter baumannii TaxID=470 RepID=UPI00028C9087|nr:macro domain-containing protein [Acinetobacter baumannii]AIY37256.1 macro domain protein [Acinetobacter baumannii LAC-4]AKQ31356.1 Appr-1-p processing protein [Acinetobacter baumannii]APO59247.1 Appr-1-p processing protein [Acinetobacter baumannii]ARG38468.1 Appr-1-p processing protein [Acinetobacter baumannii]EHU1403269.1 macro domain-containing protein [Acinetobacter baumannii]
MIRYTTGNLLDAPVEALVNTVNTVGVMGKGIALMFKERFPKNMAAYSQACKAGQVTTGKMFVTETNELMGARWIINFPTKQHWRDKSKLQWIEDGLQDLKKFIIDHQVKSIAIPPLGAGNGGLEWSRVKSKIETELSDLEYVDILIFEPTTQYQNVAKKIGVSQLTPARAMIAELVRRYWVLGIECSLLEIQKLAWFLQRVIEQKQLPNELKLNFQANYYGPYASNLDHLLNAMDGSYLKSDKRIPDCDPLDVIWFNDQQKSKVQGYLISEAKEYMAAVEGAATLIEGFESPFGMELLATVDWLIYKEGYQPNVESIQEGLANWSAGERWARRKSDLFKAEHIQFALQKLDGFAYSYPDVT